MAIEVFGVVSVGGQMETLGDVEMFVAKVKEFGGDAGTRLLNGFLSVEFVGDPRASAVEGVTEAILGPLVAYSGDRDQ